MTPAEALLADLEEAPACAKARACLQLKGVPFRRTPATLGLMRRLRRHAPHAAPPVLHLPAETLIGAPAIVDWLERVVPVPGLLPAADAARAYCRLVEQWADRVLGSAVGAVLWRDAAAAAARARSLAAELAPGPLVPLVARWVRRGRGRPGRAPSEVAARLAVALEVLDGSLAGRPYLLGDALTVADVAVYVQLARLDLLGAGGTPPLGAATTAWRARLDAIEALRTAIRS